MGKKTDIFLENDFESPLNSSIFSAVYLGLSNNNASLSDVLTNCNTGNCNWPKYPSIGICTNVLDVSDQLTKNPCNMTLYNESYPAAVNVNGGGTVPLPPAPLPCFNYTLNNVSLS